MKITAILSLVTIVVVIPLSRADVVGAWLFDETSGDVITDSSGNGHSRRNCRKSGAGSTGQAW